ncbi:MAG: DUF1858 domain-containing protein [Chloroflexi bacterium]|nr:DUF1858 domain-containing protein [Chloroflexota bacterium]
MASITPQTRLSQVLDTVPGALDYVVSLDPHDFQRLRHPMLRRYMSPRISLDRVAAIARLPVNKLMDDLDRLAAGEDLATVQSEIGSAPGEPATHAADVPAWFQGIDAASIPWVDVIQIDEVSGDPFPPISLAVRQLKPGGVLGIRHRWEPQPLYDIWSKMDLQWFAQRIGENEWFVFVHRPETVTAYPTKPVVTAEVGALPEPEVLPRLVVLAEQLARGQTLEVSGLVRERVKTVADQLDQRLGNDYSTEIGADNRQRPTLRVTHGD